ncbi:hypothetical protein M885DRAFT_506926 [Pelagophyceae sp. CCMP2097]|nr:hypothetical protein M885DRAFT_506926 [Pelagophyceae sp. CCMP2097]
MAAALCNHYSDLHLHTNATFLCERAHAELRTSESLSTLASCYLRQGQPKRAYSILDGCARTPHARYLLAMACYRLDKAHEAEAALLPDRDARARGPRLSRELLLGPDSPVPHGAAGLHLLGVVCEETRRREDAIEYYTMSLDVDCLMWVSFEALCQLGARVDADRFFRDGAPHALSGDSAPDQAHARFDNGDDDDTAPTLPVFHVRAAEARGGHDRRRESAVSCPMSVTSTSSKASSIATPFHGRREDLNIDSCARLDSASLADAADDDEAPPPRTGRRVAAKTLTFASATTVDTVASPAASPADLSAEKPRAKIARHDSSKAARGAFRDEAQSSRRGDDFDDSDADDGLFYGGASSGGPSPARRAPASAGRAARAAGRQRALAAAVVSVLRSLGAAFDALSRSKCAAALRLLHAVPAKHFETGWVQHAVGRVCFESADYAGAVRAFRCMQRVEPHRMAGLELLSTALWHLKDDVELCHLARTSVDFDRRAPEAWCAAGNCLSLQKDHDAAVRCFQRAIAVAPRFAYAYTLCGHEYVANEDFSKAVGMYRLAMKLDARHYNAWYGLGAIYYRQEKYDLAEYHFARALELNPQSSVLHCYLGMTLHASKQCSRALEHLRRAAKMEPANPQARFQCANVLISMDRYEEALEELQAVADHAPREASVHFLLGKVCKKLGRLDAAMMHFTYALDLDPKDNNLIKSAIDRLEDVDISDDEKF